MKARIIVLMLCSLLAGFGFAGQVAAQEGHPMTGSWVGDWGIGSGSRNRVVVILEWTGSTLTGTINPGPDAIPIQTATTNPDDWSLHIEAAGTDSRGRQVEYVIDGTIDDLGTYNRTLAGTWQVGSQSGDFSITRQ